MFVTAQNTTHIEYSLNVVLEGLTFVSTSAAVVQISASVFLHLLVYCGRTPGCPPFPRDERLRSALDKSLLDYVDCLSHLRNRIDQRG